VNADGLKSCLNLSSSCKLTCATSQAKQMLDGALVIRQERCEACYLSQLRAAIYLDLSKLSTRCVLIQRMVYRPPMLTLPGISAAAALELSSSLHRACCRDVAAWPNVCQEHLQARLSHCGTHQKLTGSWQRVRCITERSSKQSHFQFQSRSYRGWSLPNIP
jgi:hypothetical protein